jgi:uncharacterized membrane protein
VGDGSRSVLTAVAAVGAGVAGGVFFAFSDFVMRALRHLPDRSGLAAMQAINRAAPSPPFMTVLFGTGIVCVVLASSALSRLDEPGAGEQVLGPSLYLVTIAVTLAYHVPRNDALARVDPGSGDAGPIWRSYAGGWTTWNHLRTLTSLAAAVTFVHALEAG